jgi:hypothetical protein
MRIMLIRHMGVHLQNRDHSEACCLRRSFVGLGHECEIWGRGYDNFTTKPSFNEYDLIVTLENYGDEWIPNLSSYEKPFKVLWSIDAHILAHATLDFVKNDYHRWLPCCADQTYLKPIPQVNKTHRIGFCGNYATKERQQAIEVLHEIFGMKKDIFVIGEDMVKAVNSYRVHFNMNISNDINFRSFETPACGTALLTNSSHQYDKLGFKDGVNCFFYKAGDLVSMAKRMFMLSTCDVDLIDRVAEEGRKLVLENHTYDHRAKSILQMMQDRSR